MEQTVLEFTPEQKGLLATLSRETGKPIPALLAEALDVLQEHERLDHAKDETNGNRAATAPVTPPQEATKPGFEDAIFCEEIRDDLLLVPLEPPSDHGDQDV